MVGEFPVLVFPHVVLTIVPTTVVSRAGKVWLKNKKKTAFSSPQTHEPAIEKKLTDMAESPYFTDDGLEPATVLGISTVLRTFPDKPVFGISQDYLLCVSSAFATASSLLRERAADSVSNSSSSSGSNSGSVSTKSASGDGKKRKLADDDEAADITEEAHGASRASNGESARKRAKGSELSKPVASSDVKPETKSKAANKSKDEKASQVTEPLDAIDRVWPGLRIPLPIFRLCPTCWPRGQCCCSVGLYTPFSAKHHDSLRFYCTKGMELTERMDVPAFPPLPTIPDLPVFAAFHAAPPPPEKDKTSSSSSSSSSSSISMDTKTLAFPDGGYCLACADAALCVHCACVVPVVVKTNEGGHAAPIGIQVFDDGIRVCETCTNKARSQQLCPCCMTTPWRGTKRKWCSACDYFASVRDKCGVLLRAPMNQHSLQDVLAFFPKLTNPSFRCAAPGCRTVEWTHIYGNAKGFCRSCYQRAGRQTKKSGAKEAKK